ncbi:calponin homology (ch) domain containing protein [Entamoeba nuttalli P19]|uniref:Calponin homology (Ch) domain containing protein n=1 Tax=Entamoeba nuttalli (strain P19) TaxID=1076696 RepID=K2H9Y8_ENTNP|nr:calponin homology (ch) domain containing protein [Entamoeba nuttalli P19]EKE39409.1 calponin homology (ch) domain containing protein [Entamoeba nuttalli P19]|eukprot:XP_008858257.1 calponin homology (ch) domain containing protein [Entamoeba nuttalli P19]
MQGTQALLQWCKQNTAGYKDVNVTNFHYSWKNGLAFCALIHSFHPEAIDFNSLSKDNMEKNLELAFSTAEKLGVPRLLDVEDFVLLEKPEQFSIITYLGVMYQMFQLKGGSVAEENKRVEEEKKKEENTKKPVMAAQPYSSASKPPPRPINRNNQPLSKSSGGTQTTPVIPKKKVTTQEQRLEVCVKCGQTLSGNVLEALGKKYHQQCFGCTTCSRKLGASFVTVDNQPYCETCGKKIWVQKQARKKAEEQQKLSSQEEEKKVIEAQKALEEKQKKEKEEFERKQKEEKEKREKEMAEKKRREDERLVALEKQKKERKEREEKLKREREERLKKEQEEKDKKIQEMKEKQAVLSKAPPSHIVSTKTEPKTVANSQNKNIGQEPEWKRKQREAEEKKKEMQDKLKAIKQKRLEEVKKKNQITSEKSKTTSLSSKQKEPEEIETKKQELDDQAKKIEEEKQRKEKELKLQQEEEKKKREIEKTKQEEEKKKRDEEFKQQKEREENLKRLEENERKTKEEEKKKTEEEKKEKEEKKEQNVKEFKSKQVKVEEDNSNNKEITSQQEEEQIKQANISKTKDVSIKQEEKQIEEEKQTKEKELLQLEEKQKKEREEFEQKQLQEKNNLRKTISKKSNDIKDLPLIEIPNTQTLKRDDLTQYVLRVNVLMLKSNKEIKRPLFKLSLETKQSNIQSTRVNKINDNIGSSLFFKEITSVTNLTIKVVEESTKTVYQEIIVPLNNLELNNVTPVTSQLYDSQYPAELLYTLQLITSIEGMRQTAISVQDLRSDKLQEGVFSLRINSIKDLPPMNGIKEAYCVVKVGKQNPVQTKSIIPSVPVWNHFMAFDCNHDDQVRIELFGRKKSLLKQTIVPFGQVSISLKGIKGIQERWLTILPQGTEQVQGQLSVSLYYQDNSVEMEGADPTLLSNLSTKFEKLAEKTQGDLPEGVEIDPTDVKNWDGKAGYLFMRSQKTGKMKRRFFYLLQFNRELIYYKQQQVRFNKQREGSINEVPKVIDLAFAEIRTIPNSTKFVIILPQRQYILDATTRQEKDSWISRISDELKSIKEYASKEINMSLEKLGRNTYEAQKGIIKMLRDKKFQTVHIELRSGFIFIYEMIKSSNMKLIDKLSLYKCYMSEYEPDKCPNSIKIEDQYKKKAFIFQLDCFEDMHFWLNGMKFQQIFIEEAIDNIVLI